MEKASWTILWNEYGADTYLYGSHLEFRGKRDVYFRNEFMPSGTVIKEWHSLTNYQRQRMEPTLPIIDGESRYRIRVNIDTPDDMGCLVKLVFLDRYEREAGDFIVRGTEAEFSCPLKTYSYKMQIINGGMKEFVYHSVVIEEIEDED